MNRVCLVLVFLASAATVRAEAPVASYVFPAGGQRGTTVKLRVGGLFLHKSCNFEMLGPGLDFTKKLSRMPTLWFEGPLLPLPDSQRQEDYPQDTAGEVTIAADAPLGMRYWRLSTSQGCTPTQKFLVGDLPEVVEEEIDGDPIPVDVQLPVTINGRIFPRGDVDIWRFRAKKGQAVTCDVEAARFGSPLDANLELLDELGKRLAESQPLPGGDVRLHYLPQNDGFFQVRIRDAGYQGSQAHVYRLTITAGPFIESVFPLGGRRGAKATLELMGQNVPATATITMPREDQPFTWQQLDFASQRSNRVLLDLDDLDEIMENPATPALVPWPAVCNGRILKPGAVDRWRVSLKKGETLEAELRAARLGSPLDGVLTIHDAADIELARTDQPVPEWNDPLLRFTAPADGNYTIGVQARFRSRGGPNFSYRLRLTRPPESDFRLRVPGNAVTVPRGGKAELAINVERLGNLQEPIQLQVEGLPKGVNVKIPDIGKGAGTKIVFEADKEAIIETASIMIQGSAKRGNETIVRAAQVATPFGQPALESIWLAVAMPTPFKIKGEYDMRWASRGSVHERSYQIERNGFDGPLEIRLADRQARHLQGVHAEPIVVPAGATDFRFAVHLPPWMETGRTSRTCVMAVGIIKDKDGREHEVSFSSVNPNEQMVAVVEPGKLDLSLDKTSVALTPGKTIEVPFEISRGKNLDGPVSVELVLPPHIKGLSAETARIPKKEAHGRLQIRCANPLPGPVNMPLLLRATLMHEGRPIVAEARVEAVLSD